MMKKIILILTIISFGQTYAQNYRFGSISYIQDQGLTGSTDKYNNCIIRVQSFNGSLHIAGYESDGKIFTDIKNFSTNNDILEAFKSEVIRTGSTKYELESKTESVYIDYHTSLTLSFSSKGDLVTVEMNRWKTPSGPIPLPNWIGKVTTNESLVCNFN